MDIVLMCETIDYMIKLLPSLKTTDSRIGVSEKETEVLTEALQNINPVIKILHEILHVKDQKEEAAKVLMRKVKNAINDLNDLLEEISTNCILPQQSTLSFFKFDLRKDCHKAVNTKVKNVIETLKNVEERSKPLTTQPRPSEDEVEKKKETKPGKAGIDEMEMKEKCLKGEIENYILEHCSGASTAAAATSATASTSSATVAASKDADASKIEFLKLIYDKELSRLHKMCFTFCSLFPRDHLIDVERLIHLWRAEGFLIDVKTTTAEETSKTKTAEETLRQCFNDLLERSIFKDIEKDECDVVKRCRMQPLTHNLARFVSDQEENVMVDPEGVKVNEEILRASFDFSLDVSRGIPSSLFEKAKKLRAFLLWKTQTLLPKEGETSTSTCDQIFKTFKITLRVLDLHDMGIKTFPNSVGDMNNLRYLDLSFNTMEKLPSSITKLSNLQTLKLSKCYRLKELPKNIDELTNLNHLEIDGCLALTQMPSKIRKLGDSLQTLSLFVVSKDHSGGLKDLVDLNNLRGHLEISHLEISGLNLSKDVNYLKGKQHLQHLTLRWDHEDDQEEKGDNSTSITDMNLLECLEPHAELSTIFLVGYKGEKFSTWFSFKILKCLVKLRLYDCTSCKFLPQLHQFPKLRFLELLRLDNLRYISENEGDKDKQAISENEGDKDKQANVYFPSLKELTISDCPNLKSWWEEGTTETNKSFSACLSKLHVHYCPGLTCMPLFPGLDEELVLVGSSVQPLVESIDDGEKEIGHGQSMCNLFSKLKSMKIANIEDSQSPPKLEYFNSLKKLDIKGWKHLKSLPKGFHNLISLQSLNIENCQELEFSSTIEWKRLKNLRSLTIREIPKLETLPLGIYELTSLQDLQLHNCPQLTSLSETIKDLKSLQKLVISECDKLASLPKAMKKVESLNTLIILNCTLLLPRCQPDTGDDWPQIAHIKNKQVTETYRDM